MTNNNDMQPPENVVSIPKSALAVSLGVNTPDIYDPLKINTELTGRNVGVSSD